jgi:hypothetical protein
MAVGQESLRDLIETGAARHNQATRTVWKLALDAVARGMLSPALPEGQSLDTPFDHGGMPLTWRKVVSRALHAIDRHEPSEDNWAKTLCFDCVVFEKWLIGALKNLRISIRPKRRAGRKPTLVETVASFIQEKFPTGRPPGVTAKMIARDFKAEKGVSVSERTVGRAEGRS